MVLAGPVLPQGERGGDKIDALPLQRLGMTKHVLLLEEGGMAKGEMLEKHSLHPKSPGSEPTKQLPLKNRP